MSGIATLKALELIPAGQVIFTALPAGVNILSTRIAQGFSEIAGVVIATGSVPPGAAGVFHIYQGDGTNWDQDDNWPVVDGGAEVSFAVKTVARYARVVLVVPALTTMDVRVHGLLKIASSP